MHSRAQQMYNKFFFFFRYKSRLSYYVVTGETGGLGPVEPKYGQCCGGQNKELWSAQVFHVFTIFFKKKKKKKRKIVVGVGWDFGSHLVTIRFRERKLFHLCENICTRVYILFHLCVGSSRNNRLIYRRHISKKKKSRRRVRVSTKPNCFTKCFLLSIFFFFFFVFFFSSNYKWIRFVFVWFYFYIFI